VRRYTPELAVSIRVPSDLQVSLDGRQVAWITAPIGHPQPIPASALWRCRVDGSKEPEQLTAGNAEERTPSWSPDSRFLAFLSDRDQRAHPERASQLWVIPSQGAAGSG
jgi:Tol biopolymer transport system component